MASAPTAPAVGAAATPPGEWRPPGRSRTASVVTLEGFLARAAGGSSCRLSGLSALAAAFEARTLVVSVKVVVVCIVVRLPW